MSPRNLFVVILKIFGIYLFITMINSFYYIILYSTSYVNTNGISHEDTGLTVILLTVLFAVLLFAVQYSLFYIFCFKPNYIIDKLRLDEGFEDWNFTFFKKDNEDNIDGFFIISLALWIAAIYIFISEVPDFVKMLVNIKLRHNLGQQLGDRDYQTWSSISFSGIKILIALLIVGYNKQIASYIDNRNSKENEKEEKI